MARRALCIGVNDYPGTDSDLSGCVNDALDWAAELERRGFDTRLMLDEDCARQPLLDAMAKIVDEAAAEDEVVITYSGHGTFAPDPHGDEEDGFDEALCPWDIAQAGPIFDEEVAAVLAGAAPGVKTVLVIDACHSGTVDRFSPSMSYHSNPGVQIDRVRFMPPTVFTENLRGIPGSGRVRRGRFFGRKQTQALLLAGCQDPEYSYDGWFRGRANGAFTRAALDCIPEPGSKTSFRAWFKDIRKALPSPRHPQTPNLSGPFGAKLWRVF